MNAESHAGLPPAILVTNGFDPLRDVGHAYAQKLARVQRNSGQGQHSQGARVPVHLRAQVWGVAADSCCEAWLA